MKKKKNETIKYKSVKLEEAAYAKLQYAKKRFKCSSLSEVVDKYIRLS